MIEVYCRAWSHLHERWKQVAIDEVRHESSLVCARNCSDGHPNSLLSNIHYALVSIHAINSEPLDASLVLPLRIAPSNAATNSVNIASTPSSPAKTAMISELGLGNFLFKTHSRKTVKVWSGQVGELEEAGIYF